MEIARRHGRDALRAMIELSHGCALLSVGSVEEGIRVIERSRETADRLDHRLLGMWAAHMRASWGRILREPLVAIAWTERELAKPGMAQVPLQRQYLQDQCARAYALTGRLADAERLLENSASRLMVGGYGPPIELWQGDWETADVDMRIWRDRCRAMGDRLDEAVCGGWVAEVCRLRGDPEGAERAWPTHWPSSFLRTTACSKPDSAST